MHMKFVLLISFELANTTLEYIKNHSFSGQNSQISTSSKTDSSISESISDFVDDILKLK